MAEERLETQEVAEESEIMKTLSDAPEVEEPTPPKRATVAGLKKELDKLKQDVESDVLQWLGELDIRLEGIETTTAEHNKALLGDVKTRLEIIEKGEPKTIIEVADNIAARLEAVEADTGTLANVMRSHITDTATTPPAAAAAAGFATPPPQTEGIWGSISDIQGIAEQAQTMTDVLLICRFLKAVPTLTDADRDATLQIATEAAGVQITQGLRIRAGVQNTRA